MENPDAERYLFVETPGVDLSLGPPDEVHGPFELLVVRKRVSLPRPLSCCDDPSSPISSQVG